MQFSIVVHGNAILAALLGLFSDNTIHSLGDEETRHAEDEKTGRNCIQTLVRCSERTRNTTTYSTKTSIGYQRLALALERSYPTSQ